MFNKKLFSKFYLETCQIEQARSDVSRDVLIECQLACWRLQGESRFADYMEKVHLNQKVRNFNYSTIGDPQDGIFEPTEVQASSRAYFLMSMIVRPSYLAGTNGTQPDHRECAGHLQG